ncbi:MAG: DNA mismatch repair endonuclease MutL [Akkermansiaceae bacterium]|nr:DNA mismatch repair endonuclease MutL [Akkermansiaceae bacterium]
MPESEEQNIHLMSDILASQVAAGEVVERPASVVKELVENSIDAGARSVRVELRRGGVSLIKVTDDGCGMSKADASLCLQRHATSKLVQVEDLFAIRQLGFRGEALPSIASVSHLTLTTRRAADVEGWRVSAEGGVEAPLMNAGCAPGTEISVCNLFFNTPVRRKFLKSDETEAGHVEHQVRLHALAFPEIRFTYVRDGQMVFDVPATHDLRQRIADFVGRETAAALMRIRPTEAPGVRVSGYLMPISAARRNRRMQYIFLNGRPVEDQIINRAVRDGYGGFPPGLHPALFLYLEVEPALVDVNVHPAKREVRFRRPAEITLAVMDAVAATLAAHARGEAEDEPARPEPEPQPEPVRKTAPAAAPARPAPPAAAPVPRPEPRPALVLKPLVTPRQQELELPPAPAPVPAPEPQAAPLPNFRHIGTLHNQYAIFENKEGMVLMSPRAARERIIFERLQESNRRPLESQRLLVPELLELDTRDMGIALEVKPQLEQAGFQLSPFGRNTLRIEAIPAILPMRKVNDFVQELLRVFTSGEVRLTRARSPFEPFARQLARQYAMQEDVTAYLQNPLPLLASLLECEIPYCSPGGKSTLLPFPMAELNRRFQTQ